MTFDEGLESFVEVSFRSVWTIELLCHLLDHPGGLTPEELVSSLRASRSIVRQSTAELLTAGLISIGEGGRISYMPASPDLERLTAAAHALYRSSPHAIRRMILKSANRHISAFSDAFKFKGD